MLVAGSVTTPVWVQGEPGNESITVDPVISGTPPSDILIAGNGNDSILGGSGNDWIFGGAGNDWLAGGGTSDSIFGGTGDDTFQVIPTTSANPAETQSDFFEGGTGINRVVFEGGDTYENYSVPDYVAVTYNASLHATN